MGRSRAEPLTRFELPLGSVFGAPVGRLSRESLRWGNTWSLGLWHSRPGTSSLRLPIYKGGALDPVRAAARFRIRRSRWSLFPRITEMGEYLEFRALA